MPARKPTGDASLPAIPPAREPTIDGPVCAAETTIHNVRLYQDCDPIDPPERCSRAGIHMQTHLGWLKLINYLLGRGYTLSNIQELPKAIVEGHGLCPILRLESATVGPWPNKPPKHYSLPTLARLFGRATSRQALARTISLGLPEPDGLGYLTCSLKALLAGAQMTKVGFPFVEVFDIIERARPHTQAVADSLVSMAVYEFDKYGSDLLSVGDVSRLVDVIWCIRLLALVAAEAELMHALETAANKYLGDCVTQVIGHVHEPPGSTPGPDKGQCLQRIHAWGIPDLFLV